MGKLNVSSKGRNKTENFEGDVGYKMTPKMELYSTVCVANLEPRFYEKTGDTIKRIRSLLNKCDPVFVAKLASYARNKMYLRSVPMVLTAELAKRHNGDNLVRKTCAHTIKRVDEITEILGYYSFINKENQKQMGNGQTKSLCKMSKQMQKGIADSFHRFDEYQFAKYNRKTAITLKDAMFLTHPKPMDDSEAELFDKIANDTLDIPYTWEVEFSKLGQQKFPDEASKQLAFQKKWEELISSKKLGYMATLRNLNNMLSNNVDHQHLAMVASFLGDTNAVQKSKQLPFRFLSAYRILSGEQPSAYGYGKLRLTSSSNPETTMLINSLEDAIKASVENIKGFGYDTRVCIACDVSGSMTSSVSQKSTIRMYDIGILLGMILQLKCKSVITGVFGDTWAKKSLPQSSILQNTSAMYSLANKVGFSTNGYLVLKDLVDHNIAMDKIMMFTDCQMWNSRSSAKGEFVRYWSTYKKMYPNAKLYLFNLAGYQTTPIQVESNDVYLISGWSDKVFEMLEAIENGSTAIKEIEKISL